jgi:hypothetical protein
MKAAARHGEEAAWEGMARFDIHEPAAGEGTTGSGVHEPATAMEEEPTPLERPGPRIV